MYLIPENHYRDMSPSPEYYRYTFIEVPTYIVVQRMFSHFFLLTKYFIDLPCGKDKRISGSVTKKVI